MNALFSILNTLLSLVMRWQRTEQSEKQQQEYDELQEKPSNWFSKHFKRRVRSANADKTTKTNIADDSKN
ncbi:hypothetical protein [Piscirickettsia litoralis]|uniref:Uncharacterized protein n=1 Tax=Piscirickettsia litoralis TaxID=1891921 RepID=A0ABX2ZY14_9GAMM|nr:hypothetical protein [Piscirickettsia litoralis]ODN41118.1 hypothetical protein BGC07_17745 [Piscirickettsia litoralis]